MYTENDWRDYLAHHGIRGQKWGERNGPPYPLAPSAHSSAEKKTAGSKSNITKGPKGSIRKDSRFSKIINGTEEDPEAIDQYVKLMHEIEEKSGDWYNSDPKTERFKKALVEYKNSKADKSARKKAELKVASAVLQDLGYDDTPEARQWLIDIGIIFWD